MINNNEVSEKLLVRVGKVGSVDLYEVKDNELDILENGEPDSLYLNFAIFLFSVSISSIISLSTAVFSSTLVQNSFLFVAIIGILLGSFLFILWRKRRTSIKALIKTIRDRIPPDVIVTEKPNDSLKENKKQSALSQAVIDNPPPPQG